MPPRGVTINMDVLRPSDASTNRDQGELPLGTLLTTFKQWRCVAIGMRALSVDSAGMTRLAIFFWIANVALDTVGQLAFKSAAIVEHDSEWDRWKKMLEAPALWGGIACFVLEFVAWLALLSLVPLSIAVLIGSINIVVVSLAGRLIFRERFDQMRIAGMALISIGVALTGVGG